MLYKLVHNCIKLLWEKGRQEAAAASRKTKAAAKEISADVAIEALLSELERRRQKKKKKALKAFLNGWQFGLHVTGFGKNSALCHSSNSSETDG